MKMQNKILIIIIFKISVVLTQQIVTTNQENVYVKPHSNIIFDCNINGYDPDQDLIEWCKNDFCTWGRLFERKNENRLQYKSLPKYFIVGNRTIGEWNLLIENVTDSDLGEFKCALTRRSTKLKIESKPTTLGLMKKPKIIEFNTQSIEIDLDEFKTVTCKVYNGIPWPVITWKLSDPKNNNKETFLNNAINDFDEDNNLLSSRIALKGSLDIRNKQLICSVDHPMFNKSMISKTDINLRFAPILSFNIIDSDLIENKTQKFDCNSIADPDVSQPSVISLIDQRGQIVTQSMSGSIQLKLNKELNGYTLSCFNENSAGKSVLNHLLNISYPPQFKEVLKPLILVSDPKETVKLRCNVDSNPPAHIIWSKNDNEIIGNGEYLELKNIQNEVNTKAHFYIGCKAKIMRSKFKEINSKTLIVTNGLPIISGDSVYYAENQKNFQAKLNILSSPKLKNPPKCTKLSISKSENLKQTFMPIENFGRYDLVKDASDSSMATSNISIDYLFKINTISNFDLGIFNCSAANSIGSSSFIFEVQMKNDNSKFIIALSTSILFIILLVCLIVLIGVFFIKLKTQRNKLQNKTTTTNGGFNNTSYVNSKNSPNLSVSEWVTNNVEKYNDEKMSQCDITFEGKLSNICNPMKNQSKSSIGSDHLNILDRNNLNYDCLVMPLDPSNYIISGDNLNDTSLNYNYYPISGGNANILSSKLQTNV